MLSHLDSSLYMALYYTVFSDLFKERKDHLIIYWLQLTGDKSLKERKGALRERERTQ